MDAKAKVVAWIDVSGRAWSIDEAGPPESKQCVLLIPLTDHEAALAEQVAESQLLGSKVEGLTAEVQILTDRLQRTSDALTASIGQRDTLLSGLEALAGEWTKRATGCGDAGNYKMEIAYDLAAEELLKLVASAGLEGKTDGG